METKPFGRGEVRSQGPGVVDQANKILTFIR